MKKAIGYIRISTNGQDDKYGADIQKNEILKYARENDYQIIEWCKDIASGVSESRPMLDGILYDKKVKQPPYDAVIVFKRDRLARDMQNFFYFTFLLKRKGVKLISATEPLDENDPMYNMQMALILFCAEQERKNIMLRTTNGRLVKARKGGYAGGRCPLGYRVVRGNLVVDSVQAPVVQMIFEMRDKQHLSFNMICNYLNENGIKTSTGKAWEDMSVYTIYKNKKFYQGYIKYGKMNEWIKGEHEALIYDDDK